jgi:hypothetical protein
MGSMKRDPEKTPARLHRDGAGHLPASVTADLLARSQAEGAPPDDDRAFFRMARSHDSLAEQLGESFVAAATSGEDASDEALDKEDEVDEKGGPFVESTSETEFADGTDASNPGDATREPFPTT